MERLFNMLEQSKLENVTFYYRKEGIKQLIGQLATVDGLVKFQGTRGVFGKI